MTIFVSVEPQKYFVQQICGSLADVNTMVAPGASPATYEPKPRQMAALSGARLYFAVGVPFERAWLDKIAAANPNMRIVHTDRGIDKIYMESHEHAEPGSGHEADGKHDHSQGPETKYEHEQGHEQNHEVTHGRNGIPDPHIWLSPPLVKTQARHMLEALIEADPAHAAIYRENFERFAMRIDDLHQEIKSILEPVRSRHFMVFHPSWGYFANTYSLVQVPIEIKGKEPAPAQLQHLIEQARRLDIRVIFVQPQFSDKSARMLAGSLRAQVVKANPLALDWADNLKRQAAVFRDVLRY